jgi:hypothetical protein
VGLVLVDELGNAVPEVHAVAEEVDIIIYLDFDHSEVTAIIQSHIT